MEEKEIMYGFRGGWNNTFSSLRFLNVTRLSIRGIISFWPDPVLLKGVRSYEPVKWSKDTSSAESKLKGDTQMNKYRWHRMKILRQRLLRQGPPPRWTSNKERIYDDKVCWTTSALQQSWTCHLCGRVGTYERTRISLQLSRAWMQNITCSF